jgi:hypothetical protein
LLGQWAPIAGTTFAVLGSLYLLLSGDAKRVKDLQHGGPTHRCNCCPQEGPSASSRSATPDHDPEAHCEAEADRETSEIAPTTSHASRFEIDAGARRKVAKTLNAFADRFGTPAPDRFDDSYFKHGKPAEYPQIPGEENRNERLFRVQQHYPGTPSPSPSLRPASVSSRPSSERLSQESPRALSPPPRRQRVNTLPTGQSSERPSLAGPSRRRDTLAVPGSRPDRIITVPSGQGSPAIVVSDHPDTFAETPPSTP